MKTESDNNNQWCVSSVDEFLQYCCPDCDLKEKSKEDFVKHALSEHPMSANYLGQIIIKEELCDAFPNDNIPPEPEIVINTIGSDSITQVVHEGKKKWRCNICKDMFTIKQSAKQHILSLHELKKEVNDPKLLLNETPASQIYKCDTCEKTFTQSYFLKHHIRIVHEKPKLFNCNLCDKSYTAKRVLMEHKKKFHEGIKPKSENKESKMSENDIENNDCYSCRECGKTFAHKQYLNQHIKNIHENQPTIVCDLCGKLFKKNASLREHIHAGDIFFYLIIIIQKLFRSS